MIKLAKILILTTFTFLGQYSFANELSWQFVGAQSRGNGVRCDNTSFALTSAGTDMALTMTGLGIDMPTGQLPKVRSQWGTCYIFLNLKVPQGYTVSSSQSTILGGIMKDAGVSGYIDVVSAIHQRPYTSSRWLQGISPIGPVMHLFRNFRYQESINEPLFEMTKSSSLSKAQKSRICRLTASKPAELGYYIQLSLAGTRSSNQRMINVNIDNFDGQFGLQASTEACPR
jgi:hypothetical protein